MEERGNRNKKTGLIAAVVVLAVLLIVLLAGGNALYHALLREVDTAEAVQAVTVEPAVTLAPQADLIVENVGNGETGPMPRANLAKDFTVYTDDGVPVRLIEKRGRPVVVNFFASWCGPCKVEMPHFDEAAKNYAGQIEFMMVNLCAYGNDTKENAKKLIADGGWTFPVYFDTDGSAVIAYNVRSMPMTIFVSADGELVGRQIGAVSAAQLQARIDQLLAE